MEKTALLRLSVMVILGLAVLTGVEFWVAVGGTAGNATLALLVLVALAKAALIADSFMHFGKLFHPDEGGHS